MGNCVQCAQQPSEHGSVYDELQSDEFSLRMKNERNAFNTVNRNLNLNKITPQVNEAALQFIKAYGNPPLLNTYEHEASARRVFIKMVIAKAAYMASTEFDNAVRIHRGLMPNESDGPGEV